MQAEEESGTIRDSYNKVCDVLHAHAGVRLVAVTKKQENWKISLLHELGCRDFGENYLQEWLGKKGSLSGDIRWHFIGQVQSRKVRDLLDNGIHSIHSIGSESALDKLDAAGRLPPGGALLQINLAGEEQKGGVSEGEAMALHQQGRFTGICGLMCIPPFDLDEAALGRYFSRMRGLKERFGMRELSMGMSHDWRIAIQEGSTMIRLGTALFGARQR